MGKVAGATETTKRKKKKGRPSLLDLQKRALEQQQQLQNRRSTRRNPTGGDGVSDYIDEEDDDDERKEKKVKLVVRLPHQSQSNKNNFPSNSGSVGSDSNADGENHEVSVKINAGSGDSGADQGEKVSKATDTLHGSPLESGPTTPLPDKKLLVFILDRLQKKDTYGVFSEPVDPNELPDYHEIIEHPMDFGTVRSKLDEGLYQNLEELEADVLLICSNAMQYNSSDTVYFRQARSIQELAKRDFENLRQEGDDGVLQPKVVKRGRPPGKHSKKPVGRPSLDRVGPESTSGAILATAEDNATESNPYNLRRAPMVYNKYHSADGLLNSQRARNGEQYTEWSSDWNEEFPANIRKADMKYGKKHFNIDETRRDTYKQFHPSVFVQESSLLSSFPGDRKQLMPVGLHAEHGYARSLARFAANLGPVVWKIASKKIERVLPPGTSFGPGRVGENEASPPRSSFFSPENQRNLHRLANDGLSSRTETPPSVAISAIANRPSLPCKDVDVDDRRVHSQNESSVLRGGVSGIRPGLSFQTQPNKPQLHPGRNGYNGMFGCSFPSQMGMVSPSLLAAQKTRPDEASGQLIAGDATPAHLQSENVVATATDSTSISDVAHSAKPSCWQQVSSSTNHRQFSLPVPPDLNVGLQGSGSPQQHSSGLRIGSPQQPDLALQL